MQTQETTKYFIPDLEDLRIGYECEIYEQTTDKTIKDVKWHFIIVDKGNSIIGKTIAINRIHHYLNSNKLRTPFLTKEQIENEGWKNITLPSSYGLHFEKERYRLQWLEKKKAIYIAEGLNIVYRGFCPSINEFKYICKLLKIKE